MFCPYLWVVTTQTYHFFDIAPNIDNVSFIRNGTQEAKEKDEGYQIEVDQKSFFNNLILRQLLLCEGRGVADEDQEQVHEGGVWGAHNDPRLWILTMTKN